MIRHAWIPDDPLLSDAALGLLGRMTAQGDDWAPGTPNDLFLRAYSARGLRAESQADYLKVLTELETAGYVTRQHGGKYALRTDREQSMRSARLGIEHGELTTPRLTRDELAAWLKAIDTVFRGGHHDPETVAAALARFRERRRDGDPGDPSLLESAVTSLELAAARDRAGYDPDDAAVWCGSGCGGYHRETDPCFRAEDDGSRVFG